MLLLLFQIASGLWIHHLYNPSRTPRPPRNFIHMAVGCCLLVGGLVEIKLGIGKWGDEKWMVVSFWVWTGVRSLCNASSCGGADTCVQLLVATFTVGLSLLPRQLRTESNALNRKNPDVRLSRTFPFPSPLHSANTLLQESKHPSPPTDSPRTQKTKHHPPSRPAHRPLPPRNKAPPRYTSSTPGTRGHTPFPLPPPSRKRMRTTSRSRLRTRGIVIVPHR